MALQNTGPISLGNIQNEFGGGNPIQLTEYYRGGSNVLNGPPILATVPTSGAIGVGTFYGKTKVYPRSFQYLGAGGGEYLLGDPDPYRYIIAIHAQFFNGNRADPVAPTINGTAMSVKEISDVRYADESHTYGFFYGRAANTISAVIGNSDAYPSTYRYFTVTGVNNFNLNSQILGSTSVIASSPGQDITVTGAPNGSLLAVHITNFNTASISGAGLTNAASADGSARMEYDATINDSSEVYTFSGTGNSVVRKLMYWTYDW